MTAKPLLLALALLCTVPAMGQTYQRAPVSGSINPEVTQSNIHQTICSRNWERSSRPPESWSEPIKRQLVPHNRKLGDYQFDHLVPLCLGGSPRDPRNLWAQPIDEARLKDAEEAETCKAVCSGYMSLKDAQQQFMREWGKP